MFQTTKRHGSRRLKGSTLVESNVTVNASVCPIKLSTTSAVLLILVCLVLFSLYLSTQILPSNQPLTANNPITPNNPRPFIETNNHNNNNPPANVINHETDTASKKGIIISKSSDGDLEIALQKSLSMYILRPGHNDRVEYLIGFRGQRITDPKEYQSLVTRNTKKYDRDYRTSPVRLPNWSKQPDSETRCDALCEPCSHRHHDCDAKGVKFSMENVPVHESPGSITGNTKLDSLVPVPYFSWHDFQFLQPMKDKTADGLAAAFISNCGFQKRNNMVQDLGKYITVHSYGRCVHNKDEKMTADGKRGSKISILQNYKFSLAFENSETDDYISEKFFGSLQAGSVPVYIGAPNIKFFAPDVGEGYHDVGRPWKSKAVIYAGDFDFDAQRIAEYLKYLDGNDTAYNEYLWWKTHGYSGDFKAMVDLTAKTHTSCRQCILGTDWLRYKHGVSRYGEDVAIYRPGSDTIDGKWFYVRERGMYRFTKIQLEENTLKCFVKTVLQVIEPKPTNYWTNNDHPDFDRIGPALYAIYHVPSKNVIHSDVAIQNLPEYAELEVIFVSK